jgi:hypothetical protein
MLAELLCYEYFALTKGMTVLCRPRVPPASPVVFDVQLLYIPGAHILVPAAYQSAIVHNYIAQLEGPQYL